MVVEIKPVDGRTYTEALAGFLPPNVIDVHTHVWLRSFIEEAPGTERTQQWPNRVAADNSIEALLIIATPKMVDFLISKMIGALQRLGQEG